MLKLALKLHRRSGEDEISGSATCSVFIAPRTRRDETRLHDFDHDNNNI